MAVLGRFCWYDLFTPDAAKSEAFYGDVVGWNIKNMAPPNAPPYPMMLPAGAQAPIGGMRGARGHAAWLGYIAVDDMATTMIAAQDAGAKPDGDPQTIPGVGRFIVMKDPTGATFALFKGADDTPGSDARVGIGGIDWHELLTTDPDAAWAFYSKVFKWEANGEMEMGEGGKYRMFKKAGGDHSLGGIMKAPPGMPGSAWIHCATVPDADKALDKAKSKGAEIFFGPQDVPGGRYGTFMDPQGAVFSVYADT
ncbi:MAG: VOC family protein [Deltaproteobacteria bacterium]|nr:VOC family protein [Deltaproteobacteria bacterium]